MTRQTRIARQSRDARPIVAERIVYDLSRTALGWTAVAATTRGLCALLFGDTREEARTRLLHEFPAARAATSQHPLHPLLAAGLAHLGAENRRAPRLHLDLRGTTFQIAVWRNLQKIPRGRTASYREVAEQLGSPRAARAVAAACAANRLAILVPCHRVVRGDGSLSGYRWGVARKRALLEAESASAASARLKRAGSSRKAE